MSMRWNSSDAPDALYYRVGVAGVHVASTLDPQWRGELFGGGEHCACDGVDVVAVDRWGNALRLSHERKQGSVDVNANVES